MRELGAVVRAGRRLNPAISFHEDDQCLGETYDLVVASSSLQYAERWRELLGRLAECSRKLLLINRIAVVNDAPSFVVLQRAGAYGYATEYLSWVLSRDELLGAAGRAGFGLDREVPIHDAFPIAWGAGRGSSPGLPAAAAVTTGRRREARRSPHPARPGRGGGGAGG